MLVPLKLVAAPSRRDLVADGPAPRQMLSYHSQKAEPPMEPRVVPGMARNSLLWVFLHHSLCLPSFSAALFSSIAAKSVAALSSYVERNGHTHV